MSKKPKTDITASIWVSVAVSVFIGLIVPAQTFIANPDAFEFGLGRLVLELLAPIVVIFVAVFVFLRVICKRAGLFAHIILLSLATYAYLLTGMLAMGLPPLDGELSPFMNSSRKIADLCVLGICLIAPLIAYKFARKWIAFWSLCIMIMGLASLCDAGISGGAVFVPEKDRLANAFERGFAPKVDIAKVARLSANTNIFVFILDATTSEVMNDVLGNEPEIASDFQGFTAYEDVVGLHPFTAYGVPGIFTGKHFDGSASFGDYQSSVFSDKSALYDYLTNNIPMYVLLGSFERFGFTTDETVKSYCTQDNDNGSLIFKRIAGLQAWNLYELARFRLTPFCLKTRVLMSTMRNWPTYKNVDDEHVLYSALSNENRLVDSNIVFHCYHTIGSHPPYTTDRWGRKTAPTEGYSGMYEKACYAIRELGKFFAFLKAHDLYDNSFILITADHGQYASNRDYVKNVNVRQNPMLNRGLPCLAVKPIRVQQSATGPVSFSNKPIAQTRLASLLKAVCFNPDIRIEEIENIIEDKETRLFRVIYENISEDWSFLPDGTIVNTDFMPDLKLDELRAIKLDQDYSFKNINSGTGSFMPPVVFQGVDSGFFRAPCLVGDDCKLFLKVADAKCRYSLILGCDAWPADDVPMLSGKVLINDSETVVLDKNPFFRIALRGIQPNAEGLISIPVRKVNAKAKLFFLSIRITKE